MASSRNLLSLFPSGVCLSRSCRERERERERGEREREREGEREREKLMHMCV